MNARDVENETLRSYAPGSLASPFLEGELFAAEVAAPWEGRLTTLEKESPFLSAFEQPWEPAASAAPQEALEDEFAFEEQGIIGGDNRVRIEGTTGVPWRWICKILVHDFKSGHLISQGTGTLVSNKHVLTAAHVVYDAYKSVRDYTITVIPALNDLKEPFDRYLTASRPKIPQEYTPEEYGWDYALLTLETAVGRKSFRDLGGSPLCFWGSPQCGAGTVFAHADRSADNNKAVHTAGYPGGRGAGSFCMPQGPCLVYKSKV